MRTTEFFLLTLVFLGAFVVRLYCLDTPVADWHSWRQTDTAAVARNFIKFGFDPLRPRGDDLSNIASGFDNPEGYRMVEFPLYQTLALGLYQALKAVPGITLEIALRLVTIFASLGVMGFLYILVKRFSGKVAAWGAILIFGFLPYSVFYSRAILPEMLAVFWALGAIWIYEKYMGYGGRVLSGVLAGLAILTKPTTGFLLLPLAYFWLKDFKLTKHSFVCFFLFCFFSFGGFIFWRRWILQFPEGIPANVWLLNGGNIRFTGAYFYWLLGERLARIIFGYWLLIPFSLGLMALSFKQIRQSIVYFLLLSGTVLYTTIFARGNVQHDYYQILWLPALAIYSGLGANYLLSKTNELNYFLTRLFIIFLLVAGILLSWHEVRGYYWINNPAIIEAGRVVDELTPKDAKVIAPYGGDTAFLYQTNRQGWPIGFEIEKKMSQGASYYVNTNVNDVETKEVLKKWTPVVVNDRFVIIKLKVSQ